MEHRKARGGRPVEELGLGELCELPAEEPGHVYHAYVVRSPERDRIAAALAAEGIATARHYVTPLHRQPAFATLGCAEAALPETELSAAENLGLPIWAGMEASVQERCRGGARIDRRPGAPMKPYLLNRHRIWQAVIDAGLIALSWWAAFRSGSSGCPSTTRAT